MKPWKSLSCLIAIPAIAACSATPGPSEGTSTASLDPTSDKIAIVRARQDLMDSYGTTRSVQCTTTRHSASASCTVDGSFTYTVKASKSDVSVSNASGGVLNVTSTAITYRNLGTGAWHTLSLDARAPETNMQAGIIAHRNEFQSFTAEEALDPLALTLVQAAIADHNCIWMDGIVEIGEGVLEACTDVVGEEPVQHLTIELIQEIVAVVINHALPCNRQSTQFNCMDCCDKVFGPLGNYPIIRECYASCMELPAG